MHSIALVVSAIGLHSKELDGYGGLVREACLLVRHYFFKMLHVVYLYLNRYMDMCRVQPSFRLYSVQLWDGVLKHMVDTDLKEVSSSV
jgi:hypothetical protein